MRLDSFSVKDGFIYFRDTRVTEFASSRPVSDDVIINSWMAHTMRAEIKRALKLLTELKTFEGEMILDWLKGFSVLENPAFDDPESQMGGLYHAVLDFNKSLTDFFPIIDKSLMRIRKACEENLND